MIAFEVYVNHVKVCRAGIAQKYGILSSILSWSKRDVSDLPEKVQSEVPSEELKLTIGGQERLGKDEWENIQWAGSQVKVGDELTIKIVESDEIDEPITRKPRR